MHKKRHISLKDCYKLLQVSQKASYEDVKRSYRKKAFELHPDLNPGKPDASSNFQLLNEAYVKLSHFLKSQQSQKSTNNKDNDEPSKEAKQKAQYAYNKEQARSEQEKQNFKNKEKSKSDNDKTNKKQNNGDKGSKAQTEEKQNRGANANGFEKQHASSSEFERNKEDVLRDLLSDPFARRVFQDIYSEINKKSKKNKDYVDVNVEQINTPIKPPKLKKINMQWGSKKFNLDFTSGVGGMVKNWLRSQIDENLSFQFPLTKLRAGARLRFKISRGLSREMITVEITLPAEFVIGKPVRLKGLGKKLGSWQGDLYLTLIPITSH